MAEPDYAILFTRECSWLNCSLFFLSELVYDDVFVVWETIWAARHCTSEHFVLFIALALLQFYR